MRKGIVMDDEIRSKLVCATVITVGLLFAIIYADRTMHDGDPQIGVSLATIYDTVSSHVRNVM